METLDVKQTLYTTLLLLEFDPFSLEKKHRTVTFNKDMFVLPNKKAVEEVLYFLLNKMDPNGCKKEFRDCWPVLDKKQEQQFRRTATAWLNNIAKNDPASHLPRLVPFFTSPCGDRVYMYFLSLSRLVLRHVITSQFNKKCYQDFIAYPSETANSQIYMRVLAVLIAKAKSRYASRTRQMVDMQEKWESMVETYVKSYREDVQAVEELKKSLSEPFNADISSAPTTSSTAQVSLNLSDERVSKVCALANKFKGILENFKSKQEMFDSVLDGSVGKYAIHGNSIDIVVPDQFVKDHEDEILKKKITSIHAKGGLDILSVIKLWNVILKQYRDSLRKGEAGLQDLSAFDLKTAQILYKLKANFKEFSTLNKNMSEGLVPDLRNSVEEHFRSAREQLLSDRTPEPLKMASLGRSGLTPTKFPRPVATTTPVRKPSEMDAFVEEALRVESTPETMSRMMRKVDEEIRQRVEDEAEEIDCTDFLCTKSESEICRDYSELGPAIDEEYYKPSIIKISRSHASQNSALVRPPITSIKKPSARRSVAPQSSVPLPSLHKKMDACSTSNKNTKVRTDPRVVVKSSSLQNTAFPPSALRYHFEKDDRLDLLAEQVADQLLQTSHPNGPSNVVKKLIAGKSGKLPSPRAEDSSTAHFLENILNNETLKKYRNNFSSTNLEKERAPSFEQGAANDMNNGKMLLDDFENFKFELDQIDDDKNMPPPNFLQNLPSEESTGPRSGTSYDVLKASRDTLHLKTVEGLPLRRMTANLFELAQSRTPQIRLKTKSIGDRKECAAKKFSGAEENLPQINKFDLGDSALRDLREESTEAVTSFHENSNSKPPLELEEFPPLLPNLNRKAFDIYQNHDQRETDCLFKVKLPSLLEDSPMEKFENFLPKEESLSSTPPSVERRFSRRFHLRPDIINGESLFNKVEEEVESSATCLQDDSLIDLDGFDDADLLS